MFRNILVAIDGSAHSERALAEAVDIATAGHGRLTLLASVPRPLSWATNPDAAVTIQALAKEMEDETTSTLAAAVASIPEAIPVTKVLSHDPIRPVLLDHLQSGEYDLLVMGSRGRGAVTASLLGSVSHYVLNHSPIPVLVVHSDEPPESQPEPGALTAAAG